MELAKKKGIHRGCILFLFSSILFCNGQVQIWSTTVDGAVCPDQQPVLFLCNATGPPRDLIWSLDNTVVHAFRSVATDLSDYNTGTSSVWFRNITNAQIQQQSALIVNTLPSGPIFTVICTYGGVPAPIQTTIINQPQPVVDIQIDATELIRCNLLDVSWTHPSPRYILYYSVLLNGKLYSEVRSTHELIWVDQGDTGRRLVVQIIAIDRCGQSSPATNKTIDLPSTSEPSVATTSEMLPDMSIRNNVTDTRIIVIIVLILLLVLITGIVVIAIILVINTNKKIFNKEDLNNDSGVTADSSQISQDNKGDMSQNSQDNRGDTAQNRSDLIKIENKSLRDGKPEDGKPKDHKSRSDKSKSDTAIDKLELDKLGENYNISDGSISSASSDPPQAVSQTSQDKGNMGHYQNIGSNIMQLEQVEDVQNDVPGGAEAVPGGAEAVPGGNAT